MYVKNNLSYINTCYLARKLTTAQLFLILLSSIMTKIMWCYSYHKIQAIFKNTQHGRVINIFNYLITMIKCVTVFYLTFQQNNLISLVCHSFNTNTYTWKSLSYTIFTPFDHNRNSVIALGNYILWLKHNLKNMYKVFCSLYACINDLMFTLH